MLGVNDWKFSIIILSLLLFCWTSMVFAADWEIVWKQPHNWSLYAVDFANAKDGWMTGVNNVILHTGDGGVTWQEQDSGVMNFGKWWDVSFSSPSEGWICGYSHTVEQGQTVHWGAILHTIRRLARWRRARLHRANFPYRRWRNYMAEVYDSRMPTS